MTKIPSDTSAHIDAGTARAALEVTFMSLMLVMIWALTHHYLGLSGDGELYAFQALARLNPALKTDVYLAATSQDKYTVFSPIYAWAIRLLGLRQAGCALFAACTLTFLASAWAIARELWTVNLAWLAVAALIVIMCPYGAYDVFHYSENYLTARSMAEALVIFAFAARFLGLAAISWLVAASAMLIHPLMALPGLLALLVLPLSWRLCLLGAAGVVALALSLAVVAMMSTHASGPLAIVSGPWLDMVNERSQFLFLQHWNLKDWDTHAHILFCLGVAALSAQTDRISTLCGAAATIGVAGLLVGFIAGSLGPVAILLQGQAWRWFWVAGFVGVLTLMPTAVKLWSEGSCGWISAVLLISSWTLPHPYGTLFAAAALLIWMQRKRLDSISRKPLMWLAVALMASVFVWTAAKTWPILATGLVRPGGDIPLLEKIQDANTMQLPALGVLCICLFWTRSGRFRWFGGVSAAALAALGIFFILPVSFRQTGTIGAKLDIDSFAQWRDAIPPFSSVLILPSRNSAAFVWFSLQRPSYLTVDQSAGVVFSAETAAEIRRRSDVLLPVMDADWKLMTDIARRRRGEKIPDHNRPLTFDRLFAICGDPQLGFVMAKVNLDGFVARSENAGEWKDWNLYDCRRVRATAALI